VLLGCGLIELAATGALRPPPRARSALTFPALATGTIGGGVLASLAWSRSRSAGCPSAAVS